jgi:hypothetical protein
MIDFEDSYKSGVYNIEIWYYTRIFNNLVHWERMIVKFS